MVNQSNPEIEKLIHQDLNNIEAWAIYGDWLQNVGDPRGELIALEIINEKKPSTELLLHIWRKYRANRGNWIPYSFHSSCRKFCKYGFIRILWSYYLNYEPSDKPMLNFGELRFLETLAIVEEDVAVYTELLPDLSHIKNLKMSACRLVRIPEQITCINGLEQLNLSNNLFVNIPKWIGNFEQLKIINLSGTRIRKLPTTLTDLPKLSTLDIRFTNISESDPVLKTLRKAKLEILSSTTEN